MPVTMAASVVYHHEYSKGSPNKRGKNSDFLFKNIYVYGDHSPKVKFIGYDAAHKTENIRISGLFLNKEPIKVLSGEDWLVGEFTENIVLQ